MATRRHTRGILRDSVLMLAAGGFSTAVLAQAITPPVGPGEMEFAKVVLSQLGACTALAVLCWFKHREVVGLLERVAELTRQHGEKVEQMATQHGEAIAAERQLRIDEGAEFSKRLDLIHTSSKTDLTRLHAEAATERNKFMDAALAWKGKTK